MFYFAFVHNRISRPRCFGRIFGSWDGQCLYIGARYVKNSFCKIVPGGNALIAIVIGTVLRLIAADDMHYTGCKIHTVGRRTDLIGNDLKLITFSAEKFGTR